MGGGGSSQSSRSSSQESALSREQLKILQAREQQYQEWFFPELQKAVAETDVNSDAGRATMALGANKINAAFNTAQKQTNQTLAQQGLLGNGNSAVGAALTAQNNRSRAMALAEGYYNTLANSNNQKTQLLQIGASMMPNPTQSAQYHNTSSASGTSWNFV